MQENMQQKINQKKQNVQDVPNSSIFSFQTADFFNKQQIQDQSTMSQNKFEKSIKKNNQGTNYSFDESLDMFSSIESNSLQYVEKEDTIVLTETILSCKKKCNEFSEEDYVDKFNFFNQFLKQINQSQTNDCQQQKPITKIQSLNFLLGKQKLQEFKLSLDEKQIKVDKENEFIKQLLEDDKWSSSSIQDNNKRQFPNKKFLSRKELLQKVKSVYKEFQQSENSFDKNFDQHSDFLSSFKSIQRPYKHKGLSNAPINLLANQKKTRRNQKSLSQIVSPTVKQKKFFSQKKNYLDDSIICKKENVIY